MFAFVLTAYGVVSLAAALILAAIGPELILLLAGPGYDMASIILPGFAFAYAIAGAEYVLVVAAGVSERGSRVALSSTLGASVQVVLGASLIPIIGIAIIGPIVVLGRLTSFVTLLASVRSLVAIPIGKLLGIGALALPVFLLVNFALNQDPPLTLLRWALAGVLAVGALVFTAQLFRSRAPERA